MKVSHESVDEVIVFRDSGVQINDSRLVFLNESLPLDRSELSWDLGGSIEVGALGQLANHLVIPEEEIPDTFLTRLHLSIHSTNGLNSFQFKMLTLWRTGLSVSARF